MVKKEIRTNIKGRVARILFNKPDGSLSKYLIAKLAGCGYSWVHGILGTLEQDGIIRGTRVAKFEDLMKWWIRWQPAPKYRQYMVRQPMKLLAETDLKYALTTYQAENRIQNYLFPSQTDLYIRKEDLPEWHGMMVENGLVGEGNVRLLMADDHVFYRPLVIDGITLASVPQVAMDLYNSSMVGIEAGEMLLKKMEERIDMGY